MCYLFFFLFCDFISFEHKYILLCSLLWELSQFVILMMTVLWDITPCNLAEVLIRSILMYGSEVWTLSQGATKRIDSFEWKILWKIFGSTQSKQAWGIRYNDEIYKMYKNVALSTYIRLKRLLWAGHVITMEQHCILKKVLWSCFGCERPVGRPWNRWEDVIQRDAANLL
jgi:hypothetical protein